MSAAYRTPQAVQASLLAGTYMQPQRERGPEPFDRQTGAAVRSYSELRGGAWEAAWTGLMPYQEVQQILEALRKWVVKQRELAAEASGKRRRPVPHIALEIVKLIGHFMHKTGRFEMSAEQIAVRLGCAASSVHHHLKLLRDRLGCVVWARRCEPTGEVGERGLLYKQATNLYRLMPLAPKIMGMLGIRHRAAPDDQLVRQAQRAAAVLDQDLQAAAIAQRAHEDRSPALAKAEARAQADPRYRHDRPVARVSREMGLRPALPTSTPGETDNPPEGSINRPPRPGNGLRPPPD